MLKLKLISDPYLDGPLGRPAFYATARAEDLMQEEHDEYGDDTGLYGIIWYVPEEKADLDDQSCMIDHWESPDVVYRLHNFYDEIDPDEVELDPYPDYNFRY